MAHVKISELAAAVAVTPDDLFVVVDDPSGTPVTKKVSAATLRQPTVTTLAYAATVTTDASAGDIFDLTLTGNATLANPTNAVNGKTLTWRILQDGTGGRTVTLGNKFTLPAAQGPQPVPLQLAPSPGATTVLTATYAAAADRWNISGIQNQDVLSVVVTWTGSTQVQATEGDFTGWSPASTEKMQVRFKPHGGVPLPAGILESATYLLNPWSMVPTLTTITSDGIGGPAPDATGGEYTTALMYAVNRGASGRFAVANGVGTLAEGVSATVAGVANVCRSDHAVIAGGVGNRVATSLRGAIGGGVSNTVLGSEGGTIAGGSGNGLYGTDGGFIGGGSYNTVGTEGQTSGIGGAICGGASNIIDSNSGGAFIAGGQNNAATNAPYSVAFGYAAAADRWGMFAHSGGQFAWAGRAQRVDFVLRNITTNATPTALFLDYSYTARLNIPSGVVLCATVNIAGIKNDGSKGAHYVRKVAIKNVGGTTALMGTVSTVGTDVEDDAAYDVAITADNTNDALIVTVTGKAAETIRWIAHVEGVEMNYG